jgi:hypothetical protein
MKIVIDLDLTSAQKKIVRSAVVAGAVIAALGVGIAVAAPHTWATNDALKAADLNGLNVVSYTTADAGTFQYSVGATKFCGMSSTTTNGAITYGSLTGYPAGKRMCETATGCSTTAHMCTLDEFIRSQQLNMTSGGSGWYAGGWRANDGTSIAVIVDCGGWTYSGSNNAGPAGGIPGDPSYTSCDQLLHVMCCD